MTIYPPKIIKKKKITLDDLAAMCMREFSLIHERFAKMDDRMDRMEDKMDCMQNKVDGMATKEDLAELEFRMDKRFDRVEMILSDHTFRIERLEHAVELD